MINDENKQNNKQQILEVAVKLFYEETFFETTTKAIAAQAGVSEALVFKYFRSKDCLYEEVLRYEMDKYSKVIPFYFYDTDNILEAFRRFAKDIILYEDCNQNIVFLKRILQHEVRGKKSDIYNKIENYVKKLIEVNIVKGQQRNQICQGNPEEMATVYWCFLIGMVTTRKNKVDDNFDTLMKIFTT